LSFFREIGLLCGSMPWLFQSKNYFTKRIQSSER